MKHIIRIPVHRTSLIVGLSMACFGLVLSVVMVPSVMMMTEMMRQMSADTGMSMFPIGSGAALFVLVPVMYLVFGYIGTAIFTSIFNLIAPRLGGLPVQFAEDATS